MACLKAIDFIKQFDLARGEKSPFPNLPLPEGKSAVQAPPKHCAEFLNRKMRQS